MPRRLLTRWRRTCNRSPLAGSSCEYPNTIPTPPTILSRRSAPASGASALICERERMHTPGQFGPAAVSAFAPLCTKRERSQIGTGNRVRTGELPIRVDQFLAILAEKLCEALAYFGEDIGAMMALVGSPAPGVSHQIIALP